MTGKNKLTSKTLGELLHVTRTHNRRAAKRWLAERQLPSSADDLDGYLVTAEADAAAVSHAELLAARRKAAASAIERGVDEAVASMIGAIRIEMREQGVTQEQMAERCGWQQPLVNRYLNGNIEPGAKNLAKMATALGKSWQLC